MNHEAVTRIVVGKEGQQFETSSGIKYGISAKEGDIYWDLNVNNKLKVFYTIAATDANGYALFEEIDTEFAETYPNRSSNYILNYNIDRVYYSHADRNNFNGRGYDSTVWQKVFVNNEERYVMIAELNSVVPAFDIAPDAPTQHPITPHYDINSTDVYYKLHVQPQWGFRVAQAADGDSDENVVWAKTIYDPKTDKNTYQYWNGTAWVTFSNGNVPSFPGAIYYNKAGFNKEIESHSDKSDNISIAATGKSGMKYSDHSNRNTVSEQVDTQELEILLPSLGNSISEIWNLVYGQGDASNEMRRNLDVNWNSTAGLRQAVDGNGYKYDTNDGINTIAGCINSVHDLMGMIIREKPDIANANMNTIYFDETEKKFYRMVNDFIFKNSPAPEYTSQLVNLTKEGYQSGTYYLDSNLTIKDENNAFQEDVDYYARKLVNSWKLTPPMMDYTPNRYYYLSQNNYYLEKNVDFSRDRKYFYIAGVSATVFKNSYSISKYFYIPEDVDVNMYVREDADVPVNDRVYQLLTAKQVEGLPWEPGRFYTENEDLELSETPATTFNPDAIYFVRERKEVGESVEYVYTRTEVFDVSKADYYQIYESDTYDFAYLKAEGANDQLYYTLEIEPETYYGRELYIPNVYFYQQGDDYIFATESEMISSDTYYYTGDMFTHCVFFEPNTYFIGDGDEEKVYAETYLAGIDYYTLGEKFHVKEDLKESFMVGAEWNNQVELVPWTVTLSYLDDTQYKFEELTGFAKNFNTIHGLILRLNYLLEQGNIYTRNIQTVQGAINKLNDIIFKFEALVPKRFLTVGNTGKIYSTSWTTEQLGEENRWIYFDLNDASHKFTIQHQSRLEDSSQANQYFGLLDSLEVADLDTDNTFEVPKFKFDETGHITHAQTNKITIPENFDKIQINNTGIDGESIIFWSGSEAYNRTIQAEALTDKIGFDTKHKWILLEADIDSKKIFISHGQHGATTSENLDTTIAPTFGEAFSIPVPGYDILGHQTNEFGEYNITLPKMSLEGNGTQKTDYAALTYLELDAEAGVLTAHGSAVGELTLAGFTPTEVTEEEAADEDLMPLLLGSTDSINLAFDKVQKQIAVLKERIIELSSHVDTEVERLEGIDEDIVNSIDLAIYNRKVRDSQLVQAIEELGGTVPPESTEGGGGGSSS